MNRSLLGALSLGVIAVLFFVFWLPIYDEYIGYRAVFDARKVLLKDTQDTQAKIATLSREYAQNSALITKATLALPKQKQLDYITSSLQEVAAGAGTQLVGISVTDGEKSKDEQYQSLKLTVELTGSYPSVVHFIEAVEQSLRLYDIQKVDITGSQGGAVKATLQIITYNIN